MPRAARRAASRQVRSSRSAVTGLVPRQPPSRRARLPPTSWEALQVTFGGIAAPVFSAQSQQVTVQVPWEIAGQTSTEVVVTYNGGRQRDVGVGTGGCRDGSARDFRRREFRRYGQFSVQSGKGGQFHHDLRNRRRSDESSWNNGGILVNHCIASDPDSAGLSYYRGNECPRSLRRIGSHARIRILPDERSSAFGLSGFVIGESCGNGRRLAERSCSDFNSVDRPGNL